jgi:arsenate reductase
MQSTVPFGILEKALTYEIEPNRKEELLTIAKILKEAYIKDGDLQLIFVCTHNSRRSQMAEVLAVLAAAQYNIDINTYSAGTEATQAHENTIAALKHFGIEFKPEKEGQQTVYFTKVYNTEKKIFSKTLEDSSLPNENFFALMTCDHAAENCPFVPGALKRFLLTYDDPKVSDGTSEAAKTYLDTAIEIFSEILFVFAQMQSYGGEKQA